jgi:hypothetical protein
MNENTEKSEKPDEKSESKPNEQSGFLFSSAVKIYDPNSKEVLVQMRGDN